MKSIRTYLVVVILSVICLSNFIAALQGYRDSLTAAGKLVDEQIIEKYDVLSVLLAHDLNAPRKLYNDNTLFQIWQGSVLVKKSSNSPTNLFVDPNGNFHVASYQGKRWRAFGKKLEESDTSIIVALKYDIYSGLTEDILLKAIVPIVWVLPIVGLLVLLVINIGLRPVQQLARGLSTRAVNDLSPLETDGYSTELQPIVTALNGLFVQLSEAFEREKRFSADAAHELRTPLSALKVHLHNLSKDFGHDPDVEVLKRASERMEHCIEQLLEIHRTSTEVDDADLEICNLNEIAKTVVADIYTSIDAKQQSIELMGSATHVLAKPSALAVLCRNLIDNASKYTPDKGVILITTAENKGRVSLLVEDSGPGIPEAEYSRVLDRFYRVGGDRHDTGVIGSGLGLSIVSFIVQRYGGQIVFSRSSRLGGLAVEISFPVSTWKVK